MGYIPHVRAENMFGKTYGSLTNIAKNDPNASKNFAYSQGRTIKATKPANVNHFDSTGRLIKRTMKSKFIFE